MVASGWLVYCNSCCGALLLLWCFVSSVGILFFDFVFCVVYISLVLVVLRVLIALLWVGVVVLPMRGGFG